MTIDEMQDAIASKCEGTCEDIHSVPYVARGVAPKRENITSCWTWTKIDNVETKVSKLGNLMYCVGNDGGPIGLFKRISGSTFNKLGREMLKASVDKLYGIDPGNPDEADFRPVTNRKQENK